MIHKTFYENVALLQDHVKAFICFEHCDCSNISTLNCSQEKGQIKNSLKWLYVSETVVKFQDFISAHLS